MHPVAKVSESFVLHYEFEYDGYLLSIEVTPLLVILWANLSVQ